MPWTETTELSNTRVPGRVRSFFAEQYWAAWVLSGVGLALAGLSLWYLVTVRALYIGAALESGLFTLVLTVTEVVLFAGYSPLVSGVGMREAAAIATVAGSGRRHRPPDDPLYALSNATPTTRPEA